jgi:hypothetical protein
MLESKKVAAVARRVTCAGCGANFGCGLSDECWCADSDFRLPMPDDSAEDCLCPDCMRKKAVKAKLPKPVSL